MANKGRTQIEKIARWKVLESRLGERLAEVPALAENLDELRRLIAEAEALEAKAELHRAAAQDATVKRNEVAAAGEILRSHMVLALQYRFGATNKQLLEFGVRPRVGRKKKGAAPPAPGSGSNGPGPQPPVQAEALTAEATPPASPEPA
jgi:septal ring factor EnvC (AmiA/AmiB activator)